MANLRVDKITSTETFETTGSVQFDGSGDYLSIPDSSDFTLGSKDFTIEAWVYFVEHTSYASIIHKYGGTPSDSTWFFSLNVTAQPNPNQVSFWLYYGSNSYLNLNGESITYNTWNHVAAVRHNNKVTLYQNGVATASSAFSETAIDSTPIVTIGGDYIGSYPINGYVSNARVCKGKALYTANFKPPMRELEVTPETVLLACQSKTDAALEKTGKTITVNGDAVASELTPGILTPVPKDGAGSAITGSVEFDGTGDYLEVSSSDFAFGTGDFTLEFWFYDASPTSGIRRWVTSTLGAFNSNTFIIRESNADITFRIGLSTVTYPKNNSWAHLAYTRDNGVEYLFYNGVLLASVSSTIDYTDTTLYICGYYNSNNTEYFQGSFSNLRIVKGTALYTHDFIPPTRELKKVPGTVLLCCQDPDSPLTEATGKTITGYGDLHEATDVEMLTNGSFAGGYSTEWEAKNNANLSHSNGELTVTSTQNYSGVRVKSAYLPSLVAGRKYVMTIDLKSVTNTIRFGVVSGLTVDNISTAGRHSGVFTASAVTEVFIEKPSGSNSTFVLKSVSIRELNTPNGASNFTPQVGDDRKVTFEGVTKINSDAYFYLPTGNTESRYPIGANTIGNGRAVFSSGTTPGATNRVDYITISSKGGAQDFGGMGQTQGAVGTVSDSTRGIFAGGQNPVDNRIEYITISSTGDTKDFGDMTRANRFIAGAGNAIRGCLGGGLNSTNTIDYITIQSMGNAFDFGDLVSARGQCSGLASPTRGIFAGGHAHPSPSNSVQVIDFISIMSTGNAQDFGDLINNNSEDQAGASNEVRGLVAGGSPAGNANQEVIQYITIASTGDATDFGNLAVGATSKGGAASPTRAVFAGGYTSPATLMAAAMEFVTITSTGNAQDFGDLTVARDQLNGLSNSHGGLG